MTELFKDHLSFDKLMGLGQEVSKYTPDSYSKRDEEVFSQQLLTCVKEQGEDDWESLSLMQRLRAGAKALHYVMPKSEGADAMVKAFMCNQQLSGWLSLVCCEYIAIHKQLSLNQGLQYLKQMTPFFSAEFAIRHCILHDPEQTLAVLNTWLTDENHHVRRLISEGTRPRLPWGVRLPVFIEQPELVLPLLLALRDDSEEYVRRSVANHLNDIAKDHPELVIDIAYEWLSEQSLALLSPTQQSHRTKLIRHACRTLFKQGNPRVMSLFGYHPENDLRCTLSSSDLKVPFGGTFEFTLLLECCALGHKKTANNKLMIDYVMHFQKANGKQAPKVFKWLDRPFIKDVAETVNKRHSFKKISTRTYYPGCHTLEVMVNGVKKTEIAFELLAP